MALLDRRGSPCSWALRRFCRSEATEKPSDNSPWLADELGHCTVLRSLSGLETIFDTGPIPLWLILTCFQLARQSFNFDLYADNSLHQTFSEFCWCIIHGPRSYHLRLMLVC